MSRPPLEVFEGGKALAELKRFRRWKVGELLTRPPSDWLVHGVIPETGVGAVFGSSGVGKSFLVLDLAATIASLPEREKWLGHDVDGRGAVAYVHAEGRPDNRLAAYLEENGLRAEQLARLQFIEQPPNLGSAEDCDEFLAELSEMDAEVGRLRLVVLDTYSRCVAGLDQNAAQTATLAFENAQRISRSLDCAVLLVAHPGWGQSERLSGSYALHGALDFELRVSCDSTEPQAEDVRTVALVKAREGRLGTVGGFRMKALEVDQDAKGRPITSLVVEATDEAPPARGSRKLHSPDCGLLLAAVRQCARDVPDALPELKPHGMREGHLIAAELDVRVAFYGLRSGTQEAKKKAWGRALDALLQAGELQSGDCRAASYLWLPASLSKAD